jgi:hypothetical protein
MTGSDIISASQLAAMMPMMGRREASGLIADL